MSNTSIAIAMRDHLGAAITTGRLVDDIDAVAHHILANERRDAFEGMHVVATMIDTLRGYYEGKISASDTLAELDVLRTSILDAADPIEPATEPAIDDKFDGGNGGTT